VYTHVSVGVFTRTPFFLILLGVFNFSADGALVDAWPDFPGLKVGKVNIFVLSDYLMTLIMNRDIVRSTIIPAMPLTVTVFSIAVFVDSVRVR
jgi:hypothetical protein